MKQQGSALCVIRNQKGQYLAVLETKNRGWSTPGGKVDKGETFEEAAKREAFEEAGLRINIKGILRIEWKPKKDFKKMKIRVIYYGEPEDEAQLPKQQKDKESVMAVWVDYTELPKLGLVEPGWRELDLVQWAKYIEEGGMILPLSLFCQKGSQIQQYDLFSKQQNNK